MAKVKKFATGGISSLGSMIPTGISDGSNMPRQSINDGFATGQGGTQSSGGGGSAQDGLSQIDSGAGTVRGAINAAQSALGGGGGSIGQTQLVFKKGGAVKKYTTGGRLNLKSAGVSTAQKSKTKSNW
jgi:hypothetical protein